jgi:drug/metabolite transporter (DMT)-like permease
MLIGLPILGGIVFARKVKFDFTRSEWVSLMIGSAILTAHFLIQITGLKYTTATNTGWIISVTPLILAVISYLFLKEKLDRGVVVGIGVATLGVLLLFSKGDFGSIGWLKSTGDWLILVSAHTWAIYTAVIRTVTRTKDPLAVTFAVLFPTFVLMVGYLVWHNQWQVYLELPLDAVVSLLILAVLATALAQWFWQMGVAKIGAAKSGIFLYLEPLSATAMGVAYLGEPFGIFTAVGGLMVLAGVYLAERKK